MKKQAFTLVELIVVITILAILGAIVFITLGGYSAEARDSKRITDTSSVLSKINIEFVKGEKLSNLIIKDKDNNLTIKSSSNPGFQGIPNYEVLKEDYKNFRDPTNNQIYPFAYTIGGTGSGSYTFMQMATVSESEGRARLMGNYFKFDDNDSPSLFTSSGTTGTNIPADYLEDNGIELPYNIGMQVAPLVCNTGYYEVNNRCIPVPCPTGKYLDGNECKDIVCETGKYLDGNDCKDIICPSGKYLDGNECKDIVCEAGGYLDGVGCTIQWFGDSVNGYTFKDFSGSLIYPKSCNDLLVDDKFQVGTIMAYNGTKFKDGIYYVKPDSNPAFKVYCDMTTDGGGWTMVASSWITSETPYIFDGIKSLGTFVNTPANNKIAFTSMRLSCERNGVYVDRKRTGTLQTNLNSVNGTEVRLPKDTVGNYWDRRQSGSYNEMHYLVGDVYIRYIIRANGYLGYNYNVVHCYGNYSSLGGENNNANLGKWGRIYIR